MAPTALAQEYQALVDRNRGAADSWTLTVHTDNSSVAAYGRNTGFGVNPTTWPVTIGHTWVTIQAPNGEKIDRGFYPEHDGQILDRGVVHRGLDDLHDQAHVQSEDRTFTFRISPTQAEDGLRKIQDIESRPGNYDGLGNNCATFVQDVSHAAGLSHVNATSYVATGALNASSGSTTPGLPASVGPGTHLTGYDPATLESSLHNSPEGRAAEQLAKELGTRSVVGAPKAEAVPTAPGSDVRANYSQSNGAEVVVEAKAAATTPTTAPTTSQGPPSPATVNVKDLPDVTININDLPDARPTSPTAGTPTSSGDSQSRQGLPRPSGPPVGQLPKNTRDDRPPAAPTPGTSATKAPPVTVRAEGSRSSPSTQDPRKLSVPPVGRLPDNGRGDRGPTPSPAPSGPANAAPVRVPAKGFGPSPDARTTTRPVHDPSTSKPNTESSHPTGGGSKPAMEARANDGEGNHGQHDNVSRPPANRLPTPPPRVSQPTPAPKPPSPAAQPVTPHRR